MKLSFDTLLSMCLAGNELAAEVFTMWMAAEAAGKQMAAYIGGRSNNQITVVYY